jgi:hypothetical protein
LPKIWEEDTVSKYSEKCPSLKDGRSLDKKKQKKEIIKICWGKAFSSYKIPTEILIRIFA